MKRRAFARADTRWNVKQTGALLAQIRIALALAASRIKLAVVAAAFLSIAIPGFAQEPTWIQVSPTRSPSPRFAPAMAYDSAHGQVVLFGGFGSDFLGDTWIWDGINWTQKFPAGNAPPPRAVHAMAYDAARGQVVLFG